MTRCQFIILARLLVPAVTAVIREHVRNVIEPAENATAPKVINVSQEQADMRSVADKTEPELYHPDNLKAFTNMARNSADMRSGAAKMEPELYHANLRAFSDMARNSAGVNMTHGFIPSTSCFRNTGGTCMVQNCASWRKAECGSQYYCMCPKGTCSGGNGECYREEYKDLGTVRIRNMKFPKEYLYVSSWFSGLYISDELSLQSDFRVMRLPDDTIVLESVMFQGYIAYTEYEKDCDNDGHCTRSYTPSVKHVAGYFSEMSAPTSILRVQTSPYHDGAVMISSMDYPDRYFESSSFSSTVGTYQGDGGEFTSWFIDPPLPFKLPPYQGRRYSGLT